MLLCTKAAGILLGFSSTSLLSLLTDLVDAAATNSSEQPPADLLGQIQALAAQLSSEDLHGYSGSQLFEMQEKLAGMASCILRNLQSRWQSPPHEGLE